MRVVVGKVGDVVEGKPVLVEAEDRKIAVFKIGSHYYGIDNICPHRGGPLVEGHAEGTSVTCPWHAWTFDLKTGACDVVPSAKLRTYKVKVQKEEIILED